MLDHGLFVEKYRPQTLQDCILPGEIKDTLKKMVDSGECHNLLFHGGAGCGKTSVAKAICNDLGADYILINCSEDGNIDTLRTKIRSFASTVSLSGSPKVVILDEFDYSNAQSIQPALRGAIEEFSKNCRFIITCNYKNRIIAPIHSSYAGKLGHAIEPIIEPLGFDWKIGIGLIMSTAAREVVISTLATLYSVEDDGDNIVGLSESMKNDINPQTGKPRYTPLVALSMMVFFVFAAQCLATIAIVRQETNSWKWPIIMITYMTILAYVASLLVYQGGRLLGLS